MYLWGQVWSEYVMWSSLILYLRAVLWRTGAKVSKGMKLTIVLLLTVDLTFHHWSVFWLLGLVYSLGPQNHEKWRFSFLEIWVITPKNQGCGFPWLLVYVLGSPTCACPTRSNLPDRSDRVAPIRRPAVHCNTHSFSSKWRRFTPNSCIKQKLLHQTFVTPQKQQCAVLKILRNICQKFIQTHWTLGSVLKRGFVGDEISCPCSVLN